MKNVWRSTLPLNSAPEPRLRVPGAEARVTDIGILPHLTVAADCPQP